MNAADKTFLSTKMHIDLIYILVFAATAAVVKAWAMSMCMHARCTADEGVATELQGRLSRRANFVYQYLIRQKYW